MELRLKVLEKITAYGRMENTTAEEWKPAVSTRFPTLVTDLEISNLGRIRKISTKRIYKQNHKDSYRCIKRYGKTIYAHTLVAETFICPRPENLVIDHIDNDRNNNCVHNLRYVTSQENSNKADKYAIRKEDGSVEIVNVIMENQEPIKIPRHWRENFIRASEKFKKDNEDLQRRVTILESQIKELMTYMSST